MQTIMRRCRDISIHAPTRGATALYVSSYCSSQFQSTLPRGERLRFRHSRAAVINFNPRSHEGSDYFMDMGDRFKAISIHAPTRGATLFRIKYTPFRVFQSTLPRGERRDQQHRVSQCYTISIHAPTRGATRYLVRSCKALVISIHAPTRGATSGRSVLPFAALYFNPRSHEGSDSFEDIQSQLIDISIHAPTRGATMVTFPVHPVFKISIHAPTRGATGGETIWTI